MENIKFWAELITQTAFPIVLILASVYWIGTRGVPKIVAMIEKIVSDFRAEMETERKFHGEQMERLFSVQTSEHDKITDAVVKQGDRIVQRIDEKSGK